jgi:hypothetical protein
LLGSLRTLAKRGASSSTTLLATHLRLALVTPGPAGDRKLLKTAREYTTEAPESARLWLARLDIEQAFGSEADVDRAWADARKHAKGDSAEIERLWLWGLNAAPARGQDEVQLLEVSLIHVARYRVGCARCCAVRDRHR